MLIVAIPKSASTSLLSTLGKVHKYESQQLSKLNDRLPVSKTNFLGTLHSDMVELSSAEVSLFIDNKKIYKQHIFPSPHNRKILASAKKIILLRDPVEIIYAYRRGVQKGIHKEFTPFSKNLSEKDWLFLAQKTGLLQDLQFFNNQWIDDSKNNKHNLLVTYQEYLSNPKSIINAIEHFYNLETSNRKITPVKARYSRVESKFSVIKNYIMSFIQD